MSRAAIALGALVLALAAAAGGYWRGLADGQAREVARQDADTVSQLSQTLASHNALIKNTNAASARLRQAMSARVALDESFTKEFRNALLATAVDRDGCRFDDGIVRQLAAARDRATTAAATGSAAATVPAASGGTNP